MQERRVIERIPHAEFLEYALRDSVLGTLTDVSKLGVGFVGSRAPAVGATVDLVLMNRNVVVKGTVRHVLPQCDDTFRIGVQFTREEEDLVSVLLETID